MLLTTEYADEVLTSLRRNLRPGLEAGDAVEIADYIAAREGRPAATTYLKNIRQTLEGNRNAQRIIANEIRALGG